MTQRSDRCAAATPSGSRGCDGALILGLSVHQAEGREWDTVGVALKPSHVAHLNDGLTHRETTQRELYVACTRARVRTIAV